MTERKAKLKAQAARVKDKLAKRRAAKARALESHRKALERQGVPLPPMTTEERRKKLKDFFGGLKEQERKERLARARHKRKQKREWIEEMHRQGRRQKAADAKAKAARKAAKEAKLSPPTGGLPAFKGTPQEVADKIKRRLEFRVRRAQLLADAHTSRARATYSGAREYVWQSRRDDRVRDLHRKLDSKQARFSYLGEGHPTEGHPGEAPNCRCFAVPVPPSYRAPDIYINKETRGRP